MVARQRGELQLLIAELKDRDRELNELVASHQRQIQAWDADRSRARSLEGNVTALQREESTGAFLIHLPFK